jgi:hypothetical protein
VSNWTLPGSSIALEIVTSNESGVTPAGGVSVRSKGTSVPVPVPPDPNDDVTAWLLQPASVAPSANASIQLSFDIYVPLILPR